MSVLKNLRRHIAIFFLGKSIALVANTKFYALEGPRDHPMMPGLLRMDMTQDALVCGCTFDYNKSSGKGRTNG